MEVSVYGKKVIKRDIYQIIIPLILENILQISANLVITAMVGRLLANDISAQGICIRITVSDNKNRVHTVPTPLSEK